MKKFLFIVLIFFSCSKSSDNKEKEKVELQFEQPVFEQKNITSYTIELSLDGIAWKDMLTFPANDEEEFVYITPKLDVSDIWGKYNFHTRIRANDLDGKFIYTEISSFRYTH